MSFGRRSLFPSLLILVLGCDESPGDDRSCIAPRAVVTNAMTINGLAAVALRGDPLADVIGASLTDDPEAQRVLEYTVSCALEPDQLVELDGAPIRFAGALGLAPEWGEVDGVCDEECRGWVSACLIARINATGARVQISLRGEHPALAVDEVEGERFQDLEATYFGDLFAEEPRLSACLPPGGRGIPRVCGDDFSGCGVDVVGACADVCDDRGCRDAAGTLYTQTIDVYRDVDADGCLP